MAASYKLVNYNNFCDDDDDDVHHYPNESLVRLILPMRSIIIGPSGTGKTTAAVNLLPAIGIWAQVIILAKNLDQKLYRFVAKRIAEFQKEGCAIQLLMIDKIAELPPLDSFSAKQNTLLIVDDFVADDPKSLTRLDEIWMRGRGKGISPVFISQSYFKTPKMIRQNSDYIFIRKVQSALDLHRIMREYALSCTKEEMVKKYTLATKGDITNFFLIDLNTQDPSLQFRHNFDPME
jgi:hypothetical protein